MADFEAAIARAVVLALFVSRIIVDGGNSDSQAATAGNLESGHSNKIRSA